MICKNDKWLRTNIEKESALSIEMIADQVIKIKEDNYRWKWLIIFLHNALQNIMVFALRNTNNLKVLAKQEREKWLKEYRNNDEKLPNGKLDFFMNLYKKIQTDTIRQFIHSKAFRSDQNYDFCVKKLNSLRNDFIHFIPKGWSIQFKGLPYISIKCLEILKFLIYESGNITFSNDFKTKVDSLLIICFSELKSLDNLHKKA